MSTSGENVLEAGRAIRPDLPGIYVSRDGWQEVDGELAAALAVGDPLVAVRLVRAVLEGHPETAQWWAAFESNGCPPGLAVTRGASSPVGATGEVVAAPRFACPRGDYVWYRRSAARPIPVCRTHQVRLTPASTRS